MPPSQQTVLAGAVRYTKTLTTRFLAGFDEHSRTAQAPNLPNHAVWIMGHCAYTMTRVAQLLDDQPVSADAFSDDTAPTTFSIPSISVGSTPSGDPALYPSLARARTIFENACDRLAGAVERASDEQLAADAPWGPSSAPTTIAMTDLIARIIFHNGTHAGQLTDLRRALDYDRVIG